MGGGKGATTTSTMKPPAEIMEAYKKSLGMAEQATNTPYQQYGGQLVAGMNQNQQQAISNVNAAQGMALPYIQQGAQYTNQGAQGVTPGLINNFMSPYLQNVVGATQNNILESNAQQQQAMKGSAIQAGAFGGDRARVGQAELARQQGLAGSQTISGLLNQGYGQALGAAQNQVQNYFTGGNQLANLGINAQQSALSGAQALMAAGTQQQQTDQAGLEAQYQQFMQRLAYPYQQAQFYANIAQGIGAGAGGTSATTTPGPNPFSQILGAGLTFASMSDRRMKENVEKIGKTNDGQPIYRYNYKGEPEGKTQIGLMAQDVEKTNPDAVHTLGGIKMVDYDAATEGSRAKKYGGGFVRGRYAAGGLGMVPYADFMSGLYGTSYLPTGELAFGGHKPGGTIPAPPEGYKEKGFGEEAWGTISGMDEDQLASLRANTDKFTDSISEFFKPNPGLAGYTGMTSFAGMSSGGLVQRQGYAEGGSPFDRSVNRTFEFEGGLLPRDSNDTPTNFGINQKANPDVDVMNITQDDARGLYKTRYWDAIDGDGLAAADPKLAHVVFDTAVIAGPGRAKKMLEASGGDPMKYMQMRASFLNGLVESNPEKYGRFAKAWNNRNNGLLADISGDRFGEGIGAAPMGDAPSAGLAPVEPMSSGVMVAPAAKNTPNQQDRRTFFERITGQNLSPEARNGLMAAGLGMLGGSSPFFGVNVGAGGLAGMKTYYNSLGQTRETAKVLAEIEAQNAATRRSGSETETIDMSNVLSAQRAYTNTVISLKNQGREAEIPSWEEWLEKSGLSGKGFESYVPFNVLGNSGAGTTTDTSGGQPVTGGAGGNQTSALESPEEDVQVSAPKPVAEPVDFGFLSGEEPSNTVQSNMVQPDFSNVHPDMNPIYLRQTGRMAEAQALDDQGYTIDMQGNEVRLPGRGPEAKATTELVLKNASDYDAIKSKNAISLETAKKITKVLEEGGSGPLFEQKGLLAGLAVALGVASEEDAQQATTSDLLAKLYGQVALGSDLLGSANTAGSEKVMQAQRALGSQNLTPAASREIVGSMTGQIMWQNDMINDYNKLVGKYGPTGITPAMLNEFKDRWGQALDGYVTQGMANTPVKGEIDWNSGPKASDFVKGYKYVMPDGKVKIFTGSTDPANAFKSVGE